MTKESIEAVRVRYGLDKPIINCFVSLNPIKTGECLTNPLDTQFFLYVKNLLHGDLGISYHFNRPVIDILMAETLEYGVVDRRRSNIGYSFGSNRGGDRGLEGENKN